MKLYRVVFAIPRRGRERKFYADRYLVMAESREQAIELARAQEVLGRPLYACHELDERVVEQGIAEREPMESES